MEFRQPTSIMRSLELTGNYQWSVSLKMTDCRRCRRVGTEPVRNDSERGVFLESPAAVPDSAQWPCHATCRRHSQIQFGGGVIHSRLELPDPVRRSSRAGWRRTVPPRPPGTTRPGRRHACAHKSTRDNLSSTVVPTDPDPVICGPARLSSCVSDSRAGEFVMQMGRVDLFAICWCVWLMWRTPRPSDLWCCVTHCCFYNVGVRFSRQIVAVAVSSTCSERGPSGEPERGPSPSLPELSPSVGYTAPLYPNYPVRPTIPSWSIEHVKRWKSPGEQLYRRFDVL